MSVSLMAPDFGQGVSGLGATTSSFYLGIGLFQIPGGIVSGRIGPKQTMTLGTLLASSTVIASAFVGTFALMIVCRFVVGVGMAFVFAPGVLLLTRYFRRGSEGLGIGIYNSAFDVGGAIRLFGWVILALLTGWRTSLLVSGVIGVLSGVALLVFVPRDDDDIRTTRIRIPELRNVLFDRNLLLLGVVSLGVSLGNALVANFLAYYLIAGLKTGEAEAGFISSLVLLVPIVSSPIGGRIYDRLVDYKVFLLVGGLLLGMAVAVAGFGGLYGALATSVFGGLFSGICFTMVVSASTQVSRPGVGFQSLSVAWVNAVSLVGSFAPPIVFSYLADNLGYTDAWVGGGVLTAVLIVPLLGLNLHPARRLATGDTAPGFD